MDVSMKARIIYVSDNGRNEWWVVFTDEHGDERWIGHWATEEDARVAMKTWPDDNKGQTDE